MKLQENLLEPLSFMMLDEVMSEILSKCSNREDCIEWLNKYTDLFSEYIQLLQSGEPDFSENELLIMRTLEYLLVDTVYDPGYFHFDDAMMQKSC